jgi:PhzF family phenazine biosynthesis protein
MRQYSFKQVDVFSALPYRGNPLAVVLEADGLSTDQMRDFTHWTNLSECTFLLPPTPEGRAAGAHYRVRIFCPGRELPFAGHPTLGSCHAWVEAEEAAGRLAPDMVLQECGAGLIRIRRDGRRLAFAAPPLVRSGPLEEAEVERIACGLGLPRDEIVDHAWCDNGPHWRGILLASAERVLSLRPDAALLAGLDVGVAGRHERAADASIDSPLFEVRAFFPGNHGLTEDPVTGSLNAALAQWLVGSGAAPPQYVAAQGTVLGRAGRVHVQRLGEDLWIGGDCVTCLKGAAGFPLTGQAPA